MDGRKVTREARFQHWSSIIQDRHGSGQTIREYCSANGINEKSYFYWQRQLRETAMESLSARTQTQIAPMPAFAEIPFQEEKTSSPGRLIIRLAGAEVEIDGDVAPDVATSVIRVLRERC